MKNEIKASVEEKAYISNLLDEYVRNFESRIHITELNRYREVIDTARLAPENVDLSPSQSYQAQLDLVDSTVERLLALVGGETFPGKAVNGEGMLKDVDFTLIGPVAMFATKDGLKAGLAEQRLGSLEANMLFLEEPELTDGVQRLVSSGAGPLPFDPTLGDARKIEETKDTLREHMAKGGVVMIPILILAGAALLVALVKWIQISLVRVPSKKRVEKVLELVRGRDYANALVQAERMKGPAAEMLQAGLEHIDEPKALVEEVMYEKTLETRLRLQAFLPFVAIAAAAAPLLGLLGTVTGIINTFKLITVFGTGDAQTLSSGISEALITTKFGLIVAIPSLLLHAYLSRRAKRLIDGMEKTAVSFLNRIIPTADGMAPAPSTPPTGTDTDTDSDTPAKGRKRGAGSASAEVAVAPAMSAAPADGQ